MSAAVTRFFNSRWLRYFLFPLALLYWGVIFWRNLFYQIGFFVTRRLPCSVISVGNLSLGGTGKTPAVIYLADLLQKQGYRVAILSRGYRRSTAGTLLVSDGKEIKADWQSSGDEPGLMARQLSGIPVVVDENRYRGGVYLVRRFDPDIIVLDDAFQHRHLERDIDIVLINAQENNRSTKLFPYGRLREPLIHLRRSNLIFWTKTNLARPPVNIKIRVNRIPVPNFTSTISILPEMDGLLNKCNISAIAGEPVLAVSAVGDPDGFERTLREAGINYKCHLRFADHHRYNISDINKIVAAADKNICKYVITTEKDLLKLEFFKAELPVAVYALRIAFTPSPGGEAAILRLVKQII